MKPWIMILLLFAASSLIASCEEMKAGEATFDLGDGYNASFVLPDIGKPYVVEDAYTAHTNTGLLTPYGFTISSDGVDLALVNMNIWSSPQSFLVREAGVKDSSMPDTMGPEVIIPKTISSALGYVGYILQIGATGTDTSNAMGGFFRCFPGALKVSDGLKGTVEVTGETSGISASAQSLQVFNSMVDSLTISGPGI